MRPLNPARSSSFHREHLHSTCLRVMPTAAINSAPSYKRSLNEKEVQNAETIQIQTAQETPRHRCPPADSTGRGRRRLRRFGRTEHETFARAADRSASSCGRGHGNYCLQRDQDASIITAIFTSTHDDWRRVDRNKTTARTCKSASGSENQSENATQSFRLGKNLR